MPDLNPSQKGGFCIQLKLLMRTQPHLSNHRFPAAHTHDVAVPGLRSKWHHHVVGDHNPGDWSLGPLPQVTGKPGLPCLVCSNIVVTG